MLSRLQRQNKLMTAKTSLLALCSAFLEPLLIIATLGAVTFGFGEPFDRAYLILALIVFSLSFPGKSRHDKPLPSFAIDIVIGWACIASLLYFFGYASGYDTHFSSRVIETWFAATPVVLVVGHSIYRSIVLRTQRNPENRKRAVIAGMGELGARLERELRKNVQLGIEPVGFFDDREPSRLTPAKRTFLIGKIDELAQYVSTEKVDLIYITLPMTTQPRIIRLLDNLRDTTASICFVPDIFITDLIQGHVDNVGGIPVVSVCDTPFSGINGFIKRGSDIVLSILILILIAPIMLGIAIGVKLTSPGPVLFKQKRYGLDGKEILVYKFRSMTVCENGDTIKQATRNDSRITRLGAFLRKSSLDELPQFINVLQGRMSIVGPRPHAVAHNEMYRKLIKGYMVRHKVKPGITGWAQVNGLRGETEQLEKMQARIEYDLDYLRNWSLKLDLKIIARTVLVVVHDKHAY